MCQIAIVTPNELRTQRIVDTLRKRTPHNIVAVTTAKLEVIGQNNFWADLWIVDFTMTDKICRQWFSIVDRINPNAAIIGIMPPEKSSLTEAVLRFGMDEVLPALALDEFSAELLEQLINKIAAQDRLIAMQKRLRDEMRHSQIVAKSKAMREIMQRLPSLAASPSTILIAGETGTGKELFARAIHYLGPRNNKPFVTVDCGALPEALVENELFGHARGAYTDARNFSPGLIQEAEGGTLFLDEVETLPLAAQSRFLHFLQERKFRPLGQAKYIEVDVRVIAATNRNLQSAVTEKTFRQDLYYRLQVLPLSIPPLRERKMDIPALIYHFIQKHALNWPESQEIPPQYLQHCQAYEWPGNIRELENKVQEWLTLSSATFWGELPGPAHDTNLPIRSLSETRKEAMTECDRSYLQKLMTRFRGNISAAAQAAGIHRKNLAHLLKKYHLEAARFRNV